LDDQIGTRGTGAGVLGRGRIFAVYESETTGGAGETFAVHVVSDGDDWRMDIERHAYPEEGRPGEVRSPRGTGPGPDLLALLRRMSAPPAERCVLRSDERATAARLLYAALGQGLREE
jgi:hypothetical protein